MEQVLTIILDNYLEDTLLRFLVILLLLPLVIPLAVGFLLFAAATQVVRSVIKRWRNREV